MEFCTDPCMHHKRQRIDEEADAMAAMEAETEAWEQLDYDEQMEHEMAAAGGQNTTNAPNLRQTTLPPDPVQSLCRNLVQWNTGPWSLVHVPGPAAWTCALVCSSPSARST